MDKSYLLICDLFMAGCGVYLIYQWYLMRFKNIFSDKSMFIPSGVSIKQCRDLEGYKRAISLPVVLSGVLITICGGVNVANDKLGFLPSIGSWITIGIGFFTVVLLTVCFKRAQKAHWD